MVISYRTSSLRDVRRRDNNVLRATAPRFALCARAPHRCSAARWLRDRCSAGCSCVTRSPEGPTPQLGDAVGIEENGPDFRAVDASTIVGTRRAQRDEHRGVGQDHLLHGLNGTPAVQYIQRSQRQL